MSELLPLEFKAKYANPDAGPFADNEIQNIIEATFREFASDIQDSFAPASLVKQPTVPDYDPAAYYLVGKLVLYSISGPQFFYEAKQGGYLPPPTPGEEDDNWRPTAPPSPATILAQNLDLYYAKVIAANYPSAAKPGLLFLIGGAWNNGAPDQVVSVQGVAGGFARTGMLLSGGVLSAVQVDVAAGTAVAQSSASTFGQLGGDPRDNQALADALDAATPDPALYAGKDSNVFTGAQQVTDPYGHTSTLGPTSLSLAAPSGQGAFFSLNGVGWTGADGKAVYVLYNPGGLIRLLASGLLIPATTTDPASAATRQFVLDELAGMASSQALQDEADARQEADALKEDRVNKTTNLGTPNDVQYPSALAVVNLAADVLAQAKAYTDGATSAAIRLLGNYDIVAAQAYPAAGLGSGTGGAIRRNDAFYIVTAGYFDGTYYDKGDVLYSTAATPGQLTANWSSLDYNKQQATETVRGTVPLATMAQAQDETGADDKAAITNKKWWYAFARVLALGWTWTSKQTFSAGTWRPNWSAT